MRWRVELPALLWLALAGTVASCETTVTRTTGSSAASGGEGGEGSGGDASCIAPPDGICDASTECVCFACASSTLCTEEGCWVDGICGALYGDDACTCSDCDWGAACVGVCALDGTCALELEGCGCADCWNVTTCQDNVAACNNQPDETCDLAVETCECVDCLGKPECFPCLTDGRCFAPEPCVCPDCVGTAQCANCTEDDFCEWYYEDCGCADCAGLPQCAG